LDLGHGVVGGPDAGVDRAADQPLRGGVGDGGASSQLGGHRRGRRAEIVVVDDQVDDVPALERFGVVAARQHRHLLGPSLAGPLRDPLDGAHERVHAEGGLD
jgi:hypothetical protein